MTLQELEGAQTRDDAATRSLQGVTAELLDRLKRRDDEVAALQGSVRGLVKRAKARAAQPEFSSSNTNRQRRSASAGDALPPLLMDATKQNGSQLRDAALGQSRAQRPSHSNRSERPSTSEVGRYAGSGDNRVACPAVGPPLGNEYSITNYIVQRVMSGPQRPSVGGASPILETSPAASDDPGNTSHPLGNPNSATSFEASDLDGQAFAVKLRDAEDAAQSVMRALQYPQ